MPYALGQQFGWADISSKLPNFPGDTLIINNPPDTVIAGFHALHFINDNEGWISTYTIIKDSCVILHTVDGGDSWEIQMVMDYISAIEMFNESEGYAAAWEGTIYHTLNGGDTWDFHAETFAYLHDMDFPPESNTGYASGENSAMVRITPEGAEPLTTGTVSNLHGISFPEAADKGWTAGQAIIVMYDNGNWTSLPSLPAGTYTDIFFLDDQTGWVCGSVLGKTLNGTTWQKCPSYPALQGDLIKLFFLDANNGWGVGAAGQILQTSDGGDTWFFTAVGLASEMLINVQFTSLTNGYICGNDKILLKYTQISGMEEWGHGGVEVFPNPTRGVVSLQSAVGSQQSVVLEILDLYGKCLDLNNNRTIEQLNTGTIECDISDFPSGIYFIRISFENQTIVKKIIKL
jgi:photosystem II stability/assembly factor-like uncharacterized protein